MTAEGMAVLRGQLYLEQKAQGERTDLTSGNSCPKLQAAERVASETGVSPRTIKNDAAFATALAGRRSP